ncbi:hypothetical protein EVAR_52412_1 [Eumeta japonica]|uniref:Uncharacterized protein n=1 Tax=Eumeta variegata TaxID=151549 RepID=A0A4C1YGC7_EUMVA|nr:hypothetical protein EVAR_52412_1 [Eumeta japonica]
MVTTELERIKVGKLQDQNIKNEYVERFKDSLDETKQYECLQLVKLWKVTKSVLIDEAKKVCGVKKRTNVSKKDKNEGHSKLRMDKLSVKCLLNADGQVILAPSACGLQEMVNKMNDSVKKRGMKVNVSNIKLMMFARGESTTECDIYRRYCLRILLKSWYYGRGLGARAPPAPPTHPRAGAPNNLYVNYVTWFPMYQSVSNHRTVT